MDNQAIQEQLGLLQLALGGAQNTISQIKSNLSSTETMKQQKKVEQIEQASPYSHYLGFNTDLVTNNGQGGSFQVTDDYQTLTIASGAGEQGYWIPQMQIQPGQSISFEVEFKDVTDHGVGRHGGIVIGENNLKSTRWSTNGLVFDYIDRNDPTGYRTYYGNHKNIKNYMSKVLAKKWTILIPINGPVTFVCDQTYIAQLNFEIKKGFIGFWVYTGKMTITKFVISDI